MVAGNRERLAVWQWYWVDGHVTTSEYVAKMYEVLAVLQGHGDPVAWVVIFTPTERDEAHVRATLQALHDRDARTHRGGFATGRADAMMGARIPCTGGQPSPASHTWSTASTSAGSRTASSI